MFFWFENLVNPYKNVSNKTPPKSLLKFLLFYVKEFRIYIFILVLSTSLVGIFEASLFYMIGKLIDHLSNDSLYLFLKNWKKASFILVFIIFGSIFSLLLQTLIKHQVIAGNFPMTLRWKFHQLVLSKSINFYQNEFPGRITTKIMQTALSIRDTFIILSDVTVFLSIYFLTMIIIIGKFNGKMIIPFIFWLIFYVLLAFYFVPRLSECSKKQSDSRSLMVGRINDTYSNINIVKTFSNDDYESNYMKRIMKEFLDVVNKQMRLISSFEILNHLLNITLIIFIFLISFYLWNKKLIKIGAFSTSISMALRLNGFSHWIMWEITSLFENIGTIQDGIIMLSNKKDNVKDKENAKLLKIIDSKIEFKKVCFNYNNHFNSCHGSILKDLTLIIKSKEKVGIVGKSGSGKSTIMNLLLRFYDLESGEILIDNQDISKVTQSSLRKNIGIVTQETSLLHRSIYDNISYGKIDSRLEEVIFAAKKAGAHSFIKDLIDSKGRKGYKAYVGDKGVKLSGGQKQRIAIARVILRNAPILLLDEATSALDSEMEYVIQENLYNLMNNKTVIVIAHRLSTVMSMDRLIVLDKGRIVEEGDHESLLRNKDSFYFRLWSYQVSRKDFS